MLILERFNGQSILVGNDIVVTIFNANCGRARVGIQAPKDIKILREELVEQGNEKGNTVKLVDRQKIVA